MNINSACILEDRGILFIDGADAKDFLQNIITNNLDKISDKQSIYSSLLTPQGKYLFDFILVKHKKGYVIDCEKIELENLESLGLNKILSSPSVFTLNNQEATITQGDQIPYQTTSDGTTTTEFKEAALSLTVTPIIGDGNVLLDIKVNNDAPKTIAGADEPGISTNEIMTKLLVSDGDIVVIGGIKKNTINDTRRRTPGLSKVPVVGNLFKGKEKTDELKELLIFIAPRVID